MQGTNVNIVYIHGNRSTSNIFNFIRSQITGYPEVLLDYDSGAGFYHNHEKMIAQLDGVDNIFFVAHSLGGIHALHLAQHLGDRVAGGTTMSTPYGGCEAANMVACFLPFSRMLKDIRPCGQPIQEAARIVPPRIWSNVVTLSGGSPFIPRPNDGIVSLESMRHRKDIHLVDVPCNHFEVVLHPDVVEVIRSALAQAEIDSPNAAICA
jgi:pimeloyl-ACP methyl ester carboxylesterase